MRILTHVSLADAHAHLVEVETTIVSDEALPSPLVLFMPVWTPGSYLVREYARHVEGMRSPAHTVQKVRKNAWTVTHEGKKELTVRYRLYCNDLTVRTNHVDATHMYLNGACTFLAVEGHADVPTEVSFGSPSGWRVATALPPTAAENTFVAKDLDTLVDCPVEIGLFRAASVTCAGVPHHFAIWPPEAIHDGNLHRLLEGTKTIVETEASLLGGALPHQGYTFILHLSSRGRGGLEHRDSTTLLAAPTAFDTRDGFLDLLSLVAHEYFHLWNVKRLRPAGLHPYRYEEENYTRLLWWFEGATSYFDWRVLRLAKLCTETEYLDHLASELGYLDQTPGRLVHSLEDASFDAWIKLYRPDENSPNSTVSYYRKGELVCALLDLEMRARTNGTRCLDDVLRHLWANYGKDERPVPEDAMQRIFEEVAGVPMGDLFDTWIRGTADVDVASTLAKVGLVIESTKRDGTSLGLKARDVGGRTTVASVLRGSAAQRAGVDPGDELVAIGDRRLEGASSIDPALAPYRAGDRTTVLLVRDGKTRSLEVTLDAAPAGRTKIVPKKDATDAERDLFRGWIGD